jgi:hypothetical protein
MKKIITSALFLFALLNARGQYMSFFGDSTWEYHQVVVTQPPENYLDFPPENPSPLSVYSHTCSFRFNKNNHAYNNPNEYFALGNDTDSLVWGSTSAIHEDTVYGRLYSGSVLICDMSLAEGDTFCLENYLADHHFMLVDSVRFVAGRKMIYLSLIDHLDDYFFGTIYANQHADYPLSIYFIEGVGPSYGIYPWGSGIIPPYGAHLNEGYDYLSYLLCLHKDDSLVYLADERLGCVQTCVGLNKHPDLSMNLYPNPATQYVVLDISTGEEMDGMVVITDMMGRQCIQQRAKGSNIRVLVAYLPSGMYFLTFSDGKRTATKKFLKK